MGKSRNWTSDELDFLEEKWGVLSIKVIAKQLNRSIDAVKVKSQKIGLRDGRFCFDGITLCQLAKALNTEYGIVKSWYRFKGFPAKPKVFAVSKKTLVVRYEDFWMWAEANKHLVNLSKLEPLVLGTEPDWAKEKRRLDEVNYQKLKVRPWTATEDAKLRSMVGAYLYSYTEIARAVKRSEGAIKRRLYDLGIKARPVRQRSSRWTPEQVARLREMLEKDYGYNTMSQDLGKSGLAIRGKLEQMGYKFRVEPAKTYARERSV